MFALRPYGREADDLDVDFEHASPPHLVTDLLRRCGAAGGPSDPDVEAAVWALPVGARIAGLLRLAAAADNAASDNAVLDAYTRCPHCDERMELPLPVDDLLALQHDAELRPHLHVDADGRRLTLRRPTGLDQRAWLDRARAGDAPNTAALVADLLVDADASPLSDAAVERIEEALNESDPLVHFEVEARCPACNQPARVIVPLQDLALDRLRRRQAALAETVHRLALHYHWNEAHIFALPPSRRARYLALIDRDHAR